MNTLTLQATFCGLLHGLGKLAFRAKTAADLLAALPDTPGGLSCAAARPQGRTPPAARPLPAACL